MGLQTEVGFRGGGDIEMSAIDIDGEAALAHHPGQAAHGRDGDDVRDFGWAESHLAFESEDEEEFYLKHLPLLRKTPNSQVSSSSGERGGSQGKRRSSSVGVRDGDGGEGLLQTSGHLKDTAVGDGVRGRDRKAAVEGQGGAGVWGRENSWRDSASGARCAYTLHYIYILHLCFVPNAMPGLTLHVPRMPCACPTICTLREAHTARPTVLRMRSAPLKAGRACLSRGMCLVTRYFARGSNERRQSLPGARKDSVGGEQASDHAPTRSRSRNPAQPLTVTSPAASGVKHRHGDTSAGRKGSSGMGGKGTGDVEGRPRAAPPSTLGVSPSSVPGSDLDSRFGQAQNNRGGSGGGISAGSNLLLDRSEKSQRKTPDSRVGQVFCVQKVAVACLHAVASTLRVFLEPLLPVTPRSVYLVAPRGAGMTCHLLQTPPCPSIPLHCLHVSVFPTATSSSLLCQSSCIHTHCQSSCIHTHTHKYKQRETETDRQTHTHTHTHTHTQHAHTRALDQ